MCTSFQFDQVPAVNLFLRGGAAQVEDTIGPGVALTDSSHALLSLCLFRRAAIGVAFDQNCQESPRAAPRNPRPRRARPAALRGGRPRVTRGSATPCLSN